VKLKAGRLARWRLTRRKLPKSIVFFTIFQSFYDLFFKRIYSVVLLSVAVMYIIFLHHENSKLTVITTSNATVTRELRLTTMADRNHSNQ